MLILTHTCFLQSYLGEINAKNYGLDIYVYNIVPDLLTIHPQINSSETHDIKRTLKISPEFPKASYIIFHLLLDDLAHYGHICKDYKEEFNPDSQGYCYIKGKPLINPLLQLHKEIHEEISYNESAYRSHLIIEMLYDLVIKNQIINSKTIELLAEATTYTLKNKMPEFVRTVKYMYDYLEEEQIKDVIKEASCYITEKKMKSIMNMEGRISLYASKFGTKNNGNIIYDSMKDLFMKAKVLLDEEDDVFLRQSVQTIKEYGWFPPIK